MGQVEGLPVFLTEQFQIFANAEEDIKIKLSTAMVCFIDILKVRSIFNGYIKDTFRASKIIESKSNDCQLVFTCNFFALTTKTDDLQLEGGVPG
jgi:hypothetical protein